MKLNKGAIIKKIESEYVKTDLPIFKSGDTVKVHQIIKEGDKERIQIYEGVVIKINGRESTSATFTVRKTYQGEVAMEKCFPLHSPAIAKIEVVKSGKVRKAKLYYLRERFGKKARLKEDKKVNS